MHLSYKAGQVVNIGESVQPMIGLCSYGEACAQLRRAVQALTTGGFWIPRSLLSCFMDQMLSCVLHRLVWGSAHLSRREREVLDALLKNLYKKESASKLPISERTMKFHVANLLAKPSVQRCTTLTLQCLHAVPELTSGAGPASVPILASLPVALPFPQVVDC